jgi:Mn-dependent DtxR family transcriptional regulator
MTPKRTLKARVIDYITRWPLATNTEIARVLNAKGSSVSSITNRLRKEKRIKVAPWAFGPRGGMLFVVQKQERKAA